MQFMWKYIDEMVGKGLELTIIGELVFYLSLTLIPLAIPISILLASIITFGDLGEHYELVALKSAGIPLTRFMMPIFMVALVLAGVTFVFMDQVLPKANLKFGTLLYSITKQRPAINIKPGIMYDEIDGFVIKVGSKDPDNITLNNVHIWDQGNKKPGQDLLVAEKGEMFSAQSDSLLIFKLYNGWKYQDLAPSTPQKKEDYEQLRTYFTVYEKAVNVSLFNFQRKNENLFTKNPKTMTNRELLAELDSLGLKVQEIPQKLEARINPYFQTILKKDTLAVNDSIQKKTLAKKSLTISSLNDSIRKDKTTLSDRILNNTDLNKIISTANVTSDTVSTLTSDEFTDVLSTLALPKKLKTRLKTKTKDNVKNLKAQIDWQIKQYEYHEHRANIMWYYFYNKFSIALSCLILFLIGAAMGAIIRKGGLGLPMVVAIILFVIYYMLLTTGKGLSKEDVMYPFNGAFLPVYLLLPFSIFLVYKASNDAVLMSLDNFKGLFSRFRFRRS